MAPSQTMPSLALLSWRGDRARRLDELEAAHQSIGGSNRGRRLATQQLNRAYAVLLAGQFQGFCTTLHALSVDAIVVAVPHQVRNLVAANLSHGLMLHRGNAGPGNVGSDFKRLGIELWPTLYASHARNKSRNRHLEKLNAWRNAIAHDDFPPSQILQGRNTSLRFGLVKSWRAACDQIATHMDACMRQYLRNLLGTPPW